VGGKQTVSNIFGNLASSPRPALGLLFAQFVVSSNCTFEICFRALPTAVCIAANIKALSRVAVMDWIVAFKLATMVTA
jgi:nucleoside permease NupC